MATKAAPIENTEKYTSGLFQPVVEQCEGCERVIEAGASKYCRAYISPASKWRLGLCNFATHAKQEIAVAQTKVNPLKASKRAAGKKKK